MKSSLRSKLSSSGRWPSTLAICLTIVVSSAATATAGKLITGAQIKNSTITGADIKDGSLSVKDFARGSIPAGEKGADGTKGADGAKGADGSARAYASVTPGDPPTFTGNRVKNILSVTNPALGAYCLLLDPSIDASEVSPVVSIDYWTSGPTIAIAQVHSGGSECGATNSIQIMTRESDGAAFTSSVGFYVIIP